MAVRFFLICSIILAVALAAVDSPAEDGEPPNGLVALLTDYGADSIYAGTLKGAIYAKDRSVTPVSISHSVPPFDVVTGAYMLVEAAAMYPAGTVFCAVVDPGVGTERRQVAVKTGGGLYFVGPDNGLLALAAERFGLAEARELTNEALWRDGAVSHTFHGRDIFGPVAASLAGGAPFEEVGPAVDPETLQELPIEAPKVEDGVAHGAVVRVDAYGNVVTNLTAEHLEALGLSLGDTAEAAIGGAPLEAVYVRTYGEVGEGEPLMLIQSMGLVEFALNLGDLAAETGAEAQAPVTVSKMD